METDNNDVYVRDVEIRMQIVPFKIADCDADEISNFKSRDYHMPLKNLDKDISQYAF